MYHVRVLKLDLLSQWLSIFKNINLRTFPSTRIFRESQYVQQTQGNIEKILNSRIVYE